MKDLVEAKRHQGTVNGEHSPCPSLSLAPPHKMVLSFSLCLFAPNLHVSVRAEQLRTSVFSKIVGLFASELFIGAVALSS